MDTAIVVLENCFLRPYLASDVEQMQKEADDLKISYYMTNMFPSPYTLKDAETWVKIANGDDPVRNYAICKLDGSYIGGIGLKVRPDVEYRTMEVGYWVGQAHWGQGIATTALKGFTRWAFETNPDLIRVEAGVFGGNDASVRVLTKAGYTLEGVRRKAGCKFGRLFDISILGVLREEWPGLEDKTEQADALNKLIS